MNFQKPECEGKSSDSPAASGKKLSLDGEPLAASAPQWPSGRSGSQFFARYKPGP
jgi:hypothetical protein